MMGYWRRKITSLEDQVEVLSCTIKHLEMLLGVVQKGSYNNGTFHLHKVTKCAACGHPAVLGASTRQDTEQAGQCLYND